MKLPILLVLLSLLALWPFFKKGYFESHDGEWMVIRFTAFHQTLVSGQFPVRFVDRLNNNYGYPVLNFLYPLPFYLAEVPKITGFGFVDSIKITFVISTIFSSLAMYWALSQTFAPIASFAGAVTYLYTPYRFVDLYVRGSLGENLAFAIVPLVAGCLFKVARGQQIFLPILALSTAALILSHNVMAVLFLPFFILILPILIKKEKLKILFWFLLGILVATFFLLPAMYDLQFVKLSQIKVSNVGDHLVDFSRLLTPFWGYGPNPAGVDPLPVQVGLVPIFIFFTAIYVRLVSSLKNHLIEVMIIIFTITAILMTKVASPFWLNLPFVDVIQFPWRMLSLLVFITSVLTSFVITASQKRILLTTLVVVAAISSTIIYTKPRVFVLRPDSFYATNEDSTTVRDEYLPLWVTEKPTMRANQKIEVAGGQIITSTIKAANYQAVIKTENEANVQVNTIYFPGWQVYIDGQPAPIDYQNRHGLINFKLSKGEHEIIIRYGKSLVHLVSEAISAIALAIIGIFFIILWSKRNS